MNPKIYSIVSPIVMNSAKIIIPTSAKLLHSCVYSIGFAFLSIQKQPLCILAPSIQTQIAIVRSNKTLAVLFKSMKLQEMSSLAKKSTQLQASQSHFNNQEVKVSSSIILRTMILISEYLTTLASQFTKLALISF